MINQFSQLSIGTSPTNAAVDDTVATKPSPKKNKKWQKKKNRAADQDGTAVNVPAADNASFEKSNQAANKKLSDTAVTVSIGSNQDTESAKSTICTEISNVAIANQTAAANFQDLLAESKPRKKSPSKNKKKKSKSKKNWDNVDGTFAARDAYSTNAEGAAILASLGQYQGSGYCVSYPDSVPYSADSFESNETGGVAGSIVSGMTLEEYYGTQAAAAASFYYPQPNVTVQESAPCPSFVQPVQPVQSEATSAPYQQNVQQPANSSPYYMYGMPQYPMYYQYYPVMQNGMVFYPQHQWDENTPPPSGYGENEMMPPSVKAKLNVDAPSFEPKKM